MLWIALGFVVAMMVGFLIPRKPLKLNLNAGPKASPPKSPATSGDPFAPPKSPDDPKP